MKEKKTQKIKVSKHAFYVRAAAVASGSNSTKVILSELCEIMPTSNTNATSRQNQKGTHTNTDTNAVCARRSRYLFHAHAFAQPKCVKEKEFNQIAARTSLETSSSHLCHIRRRRPSVM